MRGLLPELALGIWLVAAPPNARGQQSQLPRDGLVVTRSTVFRAGTYQLRAPASMDSAVIIVRGNGITVDLRGVRLVGSAEGADPDQGAGVAILVDGGSDVTIRNARVRGYKVAILARDTRNLRLIDNDLSFNWKPRLYSIVEHESLTDWLSFHHNENDEWLRYGAAIYLRGVSGGEIRGNTVRQGMNGLLMVRTDSVLAINNDFSFNSGLGIGLYRSSHNRLMYNRAEFDVRGYSEGFYRRGQDSAGILLYEQSDSNTVAYNSATHSGDGFFLWAGQHTMDTGEGGANDNVVTGNDFSWATANGIEATFSRNAFTSNRLVGNEYGVWGGYSFGTAIMNNRLERNRVGVAIEHGQENTIAGNRFVDDSTAIQLWADKLEPSDWGYPKHRDTRSRDYQIRFNVIRSRVAFRIGDTRNAEISENLVTAETLLVAKGDTSDIRVVSDAKGLASDEHVVPPLRIEGARSVLPGEFAEWPRSTIVVDEWGPYDWTRPKLWPVDSSLSTPLRLRVLARDTPASWRILRARGASVSRRSGNLRDTIVVTPNAGAVEDWTITVEYRGQTFSYSRFDAKPQWNVKVYAWNDSTHPLNARARFDALLRGEIAAPTLAMTSPRLDYVWYRPPLRVAGWPQERAGVVASTDVTLPRGRYALRTISDDGIRVYLDDKLVIDDWTVHESRVHEVPVVGGRHFIRVEYFQLDGWTELRAEVVKRD